ncbi:endonuclease/exonuclease/phosphatase family protein [Nonomuraea typhae]|uniref:endonuclease/exonuclease/phosphatase family protein n=1 Tax=Nonomuraea typhae TaxID=2603600 RepID=UPI001FE91B4A|nr:endonuclease/exonuclease/phosphatase family protein [Nonomuraea typhae]
MRVGTYNVRGLKDSVPALVRVITAMRADVLCVQEAPRLLYWRARRRSLAEAAGLRVAAGGRLGGVSVFVAPRVRVLHAEHHVLKIFLGLEIRGVAIAVVECDGTRLAVASLHLDLDAGARARHAAEAMTLLERAAARFGAVPVIAGDINEQSDAPAWRYLAGRLHDAYGHAPVGDGMTFTAREPRKRIDALFTGPGLAVLGCGGVAAAREDLVAATDHLPVVAELAATGS